MAYLMFGEFLTISCFFSALFLFLSTFLATKRRFTVTKLYPNKLHFFSPQPRNARLQQISKRIPRSKEKLFEINGIGK